MRFSSLYIVITLCLLSVLDLKAQNEIVNAEYWIDNDFNSATSLALTPGTELDINESLDLTTLTIGLHYISFRFQDQTGRWSPPYTKAFFRSPEATPAPIVSKIQYFFDGDSGNLTELNIAQNNTANYTGNIDTEGLSSGFHSITFIAFDSFGRCAPPLTKRFYKSPIADDSGYVLMYKYWFNDDVDDAQVVLTNSTTNLYEFIADISTDGVPVGPAQMFKIQFMNDEGIWTGVWCSAFDKGLGCLADLNGDTEINTADLVTLLSSFGCSSECGATDINADGVVNSGDLVLLLGIFGSNCLDQI